MQREGHGAQVAMMDMTVPHAWFPSGHGGELAVHPLAYRQPEAERRVQLGGSDQLIPR